MGVPNLRMRQAVFLDRDGVLNRAFVRADGKSHPPQGLDELEILPGVARACRALGEAGFLLIVVTNQPDVARGAQRRVVVEAINDALRRQVAVDDILVCYHDDADGCDCRKPKPGLLLKAAGIWNIDLSHSVMVGDRWKDIEAGRRAGCRTVLVLGEGADAGPDELQWPSECSPDLHVALLAEAIEWILQSKAELTYGGEKS
ncbi:D-glycero-alpha-D-manno-heptose-1,7-bisphosphate 7-phosphatase [Chloroflexota bacterium]